MITPARRAAYRRRVLATAMSLACVAALWHWSLAPLRTARAAAREVALISTHFEASSVAEPIGPRPLFCVRDAHGRILGYVARFRGPGFQHALAGTVAVDACRERILAVTVTESHESPAEDLFERHPWFLEQIAGQPARAPLRLVPAPAPGVHAISGASISSHLLVRLVNESLAALRALEVER